MTRIKAAVVSAGIALAVSGHALAQEPVKYVRVPAAELLTPVRAFGDAAPLVKVIMMLLVVITIGAVATLAMGRSRPERSLAYLRAVIAGGPLIGLLGAVYGTMNGFLGISNIRPAPTISIVAPGVVEALLVLGLGLLAAIVAVACRWVLESRAPPLPAVRQAS